VQASILIIKAKESLRWLLFQLLFLSLMLLDFRFVSIFGPPWRDLPEIIFDFYII